MEKVYGMWENDFKKSKKSYKQNFRKKVCEIRGQMFDLVLIFSKTSILFLKLIEYYFL